MCVGGSGYSQYVQGVNDKGELVFSETYLVRVWERGAVVFRGTHLVRGWERGADVFRGTHLVRGWERELVRGTHKSLWFETKIPLVEILPYTPFPLFLWISRPRPPHLVSNFLALLFQYQIVKVFLGIEKNKYPTGR